MKNRFKFISATLTLLFGGAVLAQPTYISMEVNDTIITCVKGDILTQKNFDAIVNPANTKLKHYGGLAAKISHAAGDKLQKLCDDLVKKAGKLSVGDAIITEGFKLNKKIVHAVGPDTRIGCQSRNRKNLLEKTHVSVLKLSQKNNIRKLAFPSISTGIFGYDIEDAAEVAIDTVIKWLKNNKTGITEVRFVMFNQNDFDVYKRYFEKRKNFKRCGKNTSIKSTGFMHKIWNTLISKMKLVTQLRWYSNN